MSSTYTQHHHTCPCDVKTYTTLPSDTSCVTCQTGQGEAKSIE